VPCRTRRFRRLHTGHPRGLHGGQSFFARMHAICSKGLPPGPPPKNLRDLSFIKPVEVVETVGGRNSRPDPFPRSGEGRSSKGGPSRDQWAISFFRQTADIDSQISSVGVLGVGAGTGGRNMFGKSRVIEDSRDQTDVVRLPDAGSPEPGFETSGATA